MGWIVASYDDLRGIHPAYVEKLKRKEPAIRRALGKISQNTSVRWLCIDNGMRNLQVPPGWLPADREAASLRCCHWT